MMNHNESSPFHGTQVLKSVVSPWFGSYNRSIVCADSYVASVRAQKNFTGRCIGIVKTATKGFPKSYLTSVELNKRGDFFALASDSADDLDPAMAAFVWMDWERRDFIETAGSLGREYLTLAAAGTK